MQFVQLQQKRQDFENAGIGIVGLLLLGLGVSWEFGRKNLKTTSDYLRSLR